MADLTRQDMELLAALLTLEQGKPLAEARAGILLGATYVRWFAEEARRLNGEILPSPWPDRQLLVTREPVGVVGAIPPWNFPFSMLARKVAPALAAGCTTVVKPSEFTPYCGLLWGRLAAGRSLFKRTAGKKPAARPNNTLGMRKSSFDQLGRTKPEISEHPPPWFRIVSSRGARR